MRISKGHTHTRTTITTREDKILVKYLKATKRREINQIENPAGTAAIVELVQSSMDDGFVVMVVE